jgi:hypothetical protein
LRLSISDRQKNRTIVAKIPSNFKMEISHDPRYSHMVGNGLNTQSPLLIPEAADAFSAARHFVLMALGIAYSERKLKPASVHPTIEKDLQFQNN